MLSSQLNTACIVRVPFLVLFTDYMDATCGQSIDMAEVHSASVETSKALTYPNDLDCTVTFQAPAGKRFYLLIKYVGPY